MAKISVEEWRTVQDFPNYEVSNFGNVRSKDRVSMRRGVPARIKGELLLPQDIGGYKRVTLYGGTRKAHKQFQVHRLVAQAFIPNPYGKPCINHKDENRANNHVSNLEWCTHKYNSNYGTAIRRRVSHQDWDSIAEKQAIAVEQIDMNGNIVKVWPSMMDCERQSEFRSSGISRCCSGYLKTYKGYVWRKANENERERPTYYEELRAILW